MSSRDRRTGGLSKPLVAELRELTVGDSGLGVAAVEPVDLEGVVDGFTFSSSSVSVSDSSLVVSSSLLDSGSLAFDLSAAVVVALVLVGLDWWLGKNRL